MTTRRPSEPPSKTVNLDRRRFLSHAGTGLGAVLANPKLGLLSAALGGGALSQAQEGFESAQNSRQGAPFEPLSLVQIEAALHSQGELGRWILPAPVRATRLIRSAEPLNVSGFPFGFGAGMPAVFAIPSKLTEGGRKGVGVAVPHSKVRNEEGISTTLRCHSLGVSTLEIFYEATGRWWHKVNTPQNRSWNAQTPVVLDGLVNGVQVSREGVGLWGVSAVATTPWNTILLTEMPWDDKWKALQFDVENEGDGISDVGYVSEIHLTTGTLIKKMSLGRLGAQSLAVACHTGRKGCLYLLGRQLYRFLSHQYFDARNLNSNTSMWDAGSLFVANLEKKCWEPVAAPDEFYNLSSKAGGLNLTYDETTQTLIGVWGGRIHFIKENLNLDGMATFEMTEFAVLGLPDWVTEINQLALDGRGGAWIVASGQGQIILGFVVLSGKNKGQFSALAMRPGLENAYLTFLPGSMDLIVCAQGGGSVSEVWVFDRIELAAKTKVSK